MRARLVQLTDLHLTARADGRVYGSRVWQNLDRVLTRLAALEPVDRVVLTGDLANSGSAEAYARLAERLAPWRDRLLLVPGNHDHRERLRAAFPQAWPAARQHLAFADELAGHRLLGLDSLLPGRTRAHYDVRQLAWLAAELAAHTAPWLLFVHHPPVRVRTWWLDKDLARDRDQLAAVVAARPPRLICAGHVHHEVHGTFAGAPVLTAPAVAYQYGPRTWLPLPRSRVPALRILELDAAGVRARLETA